MRITVISRYWPSCEHSGLSLAAAHHVNMLTASGYNVSIIGSNKSIVEEKIFVDSKYFVSAKGSGALYSIPYVDESALTNAIKSSSPDLVMVEAWQTSLTEKSIDIAFELGIPVVMISHGISIHPYSSSFRDLFRSLGWVYYRFFVLPKKIKKLTAITALDQNSLSSRFYDRDLALKLGVPVFKLVNSPVNWTTKRKTRSERLSQILLIGYFSPIKNQLAAIELLKMLPEDISLKFVGSKKGIYYERCLKKVEELALNLRVCFCDDSECDLAEQMSLSLAVLSTSITEVLPICLIEAMACGTPFVAPSVGAIPSLNAGLIANDNISRRDAIFRLADNNDLWMSLSEAGIDQFESRYSEKQVFEDIQRVVEMSISK